MATLRKLCNADFNDGPRFSLFVHCEPWVESVATLLLSESCLSGAKGIVPWFLDKIWSEVSVDTCETLL